jgi:hypothetical protein
MLFSKFNKNNINTDPREKIFQTASVTLPSHIVTMYLMSVTFTMSGSITENYLQRSEGTLIFLESGKASFPES